MSLDTRELLSLLRRVVVDPSNLRVLEELEGRIAHSEREE